MIDNKQLVRIRPPCFSKVSGRGFNSRPFTLQFDTFYDVIHALLQCDLAPFARRENSIKLERS